MKAVFDLSFHYERTQPLSDIIGRKEAMLTLTSEREVSIHVSIMTSRGLSYFETIRLNKTPYLIPYNYPAGRDWSVLQIQAVEPLKPFEEPYTVLLTIETF